MTSDQLDRLAVDVMGWVESKDGTLWHDVISGELPLALNKKKWKPHKDLNQFLPLLDAFNALPRSIKDGLFLEVRNEAVNHWEFMETNLVDMEDNIIATAKTKEVASKGCEAILKRLEG